MDLQKAEVIEAICQRYHVPPSVAAREPAWILRHMTILNLARSDMPRETEVDGGLAGLMVSLGATS